MHNQHEQYENARKRVKQKKRLYYHFIVFVLGSIILTVLNKALGYGEEFIQDWYIIAIIIWGFLFAMHFVNVFITNRFFGKEWERIQTEKILAKHDKKVNKLEQKINKEQSLQQEVKEQQLKKQEITIIAAIGQNNELGKDNKLIWHLSNDLKRFKALTSGHHIIMGRKTFESFPKALPNRTNVVITRDTNYQAENAVVVHSIEDALALAKNDTQPFIIGGGEIYKQSLAFTHKIELTKVHHSFEADTFFPNLNPDNWIETNREDCFKDDKHKYDYSYITYIKA